MKLGTKTTKVGMMAHILLLLKKKAKMRLFIRQFLCL